MKSNNNIHKFFSIKLMLTIFYTVLFTFLLKEKMITETPYVNLITIIITVYFTANVGTKAVSKYTRGSK